MYDKKTIEDLGVRVASSVYALMQGDALEIVYGKMRELKVRVRPDSWSWKVAEINEDSIYLKLSAAATTNDSDNSGTSQLACELDVNYSDLRYIGLSDYAAAKAALELPLILSGHNHWVFSEDEECCNVIIHTKEKVAAKCSSYSMSYELERVKAVLGSSALQTFSVLVKPDFTDEELKGLLANQPEIGQVDLVSLQDLKRLFVKELDDLVELTPERFKVVVDFLPETHTYFYMKGVGRDVLTSNQGYDLWKDQAFRVLLYRKASATRTAFEEKLVQVFGPLKDDNITRFDPALVRWAECAAGVSPAKYTADELSKLFKTGDAITVNGLDCVFGGMASEVTFWANLQGYANGFQVDCVRDISKRQ